MKKGGAVYIMSNNLNTTLYVGVTSILKERIYQHKNDFNPKSFTAKYKLYKLVYYEVFHRIEDAIFREKQLKAGSRTKKEKLIYSVNPEWKDLFETISE